MAVRALTRYACQECGAAQAKWHGRCPACGAWSSLLEERAAPEKRRGGGTEPRRPIALADVPTADADRLETGVGELDRVLGGGLVPGSLVLVGGDPGVGKSTLLTMALARIAARAPVLLVAGEESPAQVRLRAERIGGAGRIAVVAETDLDVVAATLAAERPAVAVVDSVQTLWTADLASAPGSVAQVREAAGRLLRVAKEHGVTIVLIGHVTKDGAVAGPRVLEHLVDVVLLVEGERTAGLRVLRAAKNRFGSTSEVGLLTMTSSGLETVDDPAALVDRAELGAPGSVVTCTVEGTRPLLLEVQALVSPSDLPSPRRLATGFDRNRLAMLLAVLGRHAGHHARRLRRLRQRRRRRAGRGARRGPRRGPRGGLRRPGRAAGPAAGVRRDRADGPAAGGAAGGAPHRRGVAPGHPARPGAGRRADERRVQPADGVDAARGAGDRARSAVVGSAPAATSARQSGHRQRSKRRFSSPSRSAGTSTSTHQHAPVPAPQPNDAPHASQVEGARSTARRASARRKTSRGGPSAARAA